MNISKIKAFLKTHNTGKFLEYQATDKGLTLSDLEYMCKEHYIVWVKDDEYRVTPKGSSFAFEKD